MRAEALEDDHGRESAENQGFEHSEDDVRIGKEQYRSRFSSIGIRHRPEIENHVASGRDSRRRRFHDAFRVRCDRSLRSGDYRFFDRYEPGLSAKQVRKVFLDSFTADTYLTSANAVTEHGELYCVDGTSNRVAAMLYGPEKVVVIVGWEKIVPDLAAAVVRVKTVAAPANAVRLDCDTYCVKNGRCMSPVCDGRNIMALPAGACENSICCNSVVLSRQRQKGRITVLIVGEETGY